MYTRLIIQGGQRIETNKMGNNDVNNLGSFVNERSKDMTIYFCCVPKVPMLLLIRSPGHFSSQVKVHLITRQTPMVKAPIDGVKLIFPLILILNRFTVYFLE